MRDRDVELTWKKPVVEHLAEEGYDPFFGARPLKRLIQNDVVNMLSKGILEGKIPGDSIVDLKYEKDKFSFDAEEEKIKDKKPRGAIWSVVFVTALQILEFGQFSPHRISGLRKSMFWSLVNFALTASAVDVSSPGFQAGVMR